MDIKGKAVLQLMLKMTQAFPIMYAISASPSFPTARKHSQSMLGRLA